MIRHNLCLKLVVFQQETEPKRELNSERIWRDIFYLESNINLNM